MVGKLGAWMPKHVLLSLITGAQTAGNRCVLRKASLLMADKVLTHVKFS